MSHVQHKKHSNIVQNVAGKEDMANLKSAMTKRHVQQQESPQQETLLTSLTVPY